jgi:hypothetical protein
MRLAESVENGPEAADASGGSESSVTRMPCHRAQDVTGESAESEKNVRTGAYELTGHRSAQAAAWRR